MKSIEFQSVFIERSAWESETATKVKNYFKNVQLIEDDQLSKKSFSYSGGKKILLIKNFKGHFFKRCPGASQKKALACCNYFILNLGSGCNLDCSYCYLQSYLTQPTTTIYANIESALNELQVMAQDFSHLPFRIGTGEIIDSLSLDPLTGYSQKLIEFFKTVPNWKLEFKTKTDFVDQFVDLPHAKNVICSWSVNSQFVTATEEHFTSSLQERLLAARKCKDRGFLVSFHIDPLIFYSDWQVGYSDLVQRITDLFRPEEVHLISIGALRFQKEQIQTMRQRFASSSLVNQAEVFPSETGKYRFDQRIRQKMFHWVVQQFNRNSSAWNTFLCMETPENWMATYESLPSQIPALKEAFRPLPKIKKPEVPVTLS